MSFSSVIEKTKTLRTLIYAMLFLFMSSIHNRLCNPLKGHCLENGIKIRQQFFNYLLFECEQIVSFDFKVWFIKIMVIISLVPNFNDNYDSKCKKK